MADIKSLLRKLGATNPELALELALHEDKEYVVRKLQEVTGHLVIDLRRTDPSVRKRYIERTTRTRP